MTSRQTETRHYNFQVTQLLENPGKKMIAEGIHRHGRLVTIPNKLEMRLLQARTVLVLSVLGTAIHVESTSCPSITTGGPLRPAGRNPICCRAPRQQNTYPNLFLTIGPDPLPDGYPVDHVGDLSQQCYSITVQVEHHNMIVKCRAVLTINGGERECENTFTLKVFKMTPPHISGPTSTKSGEEHTWTCLVETVTYDNSDDFSLWWHVNEVDVRNDRKIATSAGFLDTSRRLLALHSVKSRLTIRAPRNTGTEAITMSLECVTWHVGLQDAGIAVTRRILVSVAPQPTTTTTTTTTSPPHHSHHHELARRESTAAAPLRVPGATSHRATSVPPPLISVVCAVCTRPRMEAGEKGGGGGGGGDGVSRVPCGHPSPSEVEGLIIVAIRAVIAATRAAPSTWPVLHHLAPISHRLMSTGRR